MLLGEMIRRIGETYDRSLGQKGEAQQLIRMAPKLVEDMVRAGLVPGASGGKGNAAIVPWIAVFNPTETTTAQSGMYVVYLFDAEMKTVALSLNQGVTELINRFGTRDGRRMLAAQAAAIRGRLPDPYVNDFEPEIDLRSNAALPRNYEAGNILAKVYSLNDLPSESVLADDLEGFVVMYDLALEIRDALRFSAPDAIVTTKAVDLPQDEPEFKPKNDAEYTQIIAARKIRKKRDHETVIKQYGRYLQVQGFTLNTKVHPRDLTASRDGDHWLIEVKVVYRRNGIDATRDALSQLLMYREFIYPAGQPVLMLAVFSESVGPLCVEFLEKFHIASVWKDGAGWSGSHSAMLAGLCFA